MVDILCSAGACDGANKGAELELFAPWGER
ncbi:MAG: hypothetical protein RL375_994 [Pseudomonadota bacterium]|jgi:hypothetical protein